MSLARGLSAAAHGAGVTFAGAGFSDAPLSNCLLVFLEVGVILEINRLLEFGS